MRTTLLLTGLLALCAAPAWADEVQEDATANMTQVAPGLWAIPGDGAPMWFSEGQYYVCSAGRWSATPGGDLSWQPKATRELPESIRDGLDADRYASSGLCPGDALPPTVATAIGGPSVMIVGGYPRVIRVGPYFHGWRPSSAWVRPAFFPVRPRVWGGYSRPAYYGGYRGGYTTTYGGGYRGGYGGSGYRGGYGGGHGGYGGGHRR